MYNGFVCDNLLTKRVRNIYEESKMFQKFKHNEATELFCVKLVESDTIKRNSDWLYLNIAHAWKIVCRWNSYIGMPDTYVFTS